MSSRNRPLSTQEAAEQVDDAVRKCAAERVIACTALQMIMSLPLAKLREFGRMIDIRSIHASAGVSSFGVRVELPLTHLSLLEGLKDQDRHNEAWTLFDSLYRPVIYQWCLRRGLQNVDAEDVGQKVLLRLYHALPVHQHDPNRGSFRNWLRTVVGNAIRDYFRTTNRHPDWHGTGGSEALGLFAQLETPESVDDLAGPLELAGDPKVQEALAKVKERVGERTWRIFRLVVVEQESVADIAAAERMTAPAVYRAVYRVRQMIVEEYQRPTALTQ